MKPKNGKLTIRNGDVTIRRKVLERRLQSMPPEKRDEFLILAIDKFLGLPGPKENTPKLSKRQTRALSLGLAVLGPTPKHLEGEDRRQFEGAMENARFWAKQTGKVAAR